MKAPDKIYIDAEELDGVLDTDYLSLIGWTTKPLNPITYIHKDALVEWLTECKNNPVITDLQKGNIQELIDHINEM